MQSSTDSAKDCVITTFIMESIIRRTIVIVEEKVDGKLINRTVNEVRHRVVCYILTCVVLPYAFTQ